MQGKVLHIVYFALFCLCGYACSRQEPSSMPQTKSEDVPAVISEALTARHQMARLDDIGSRFLKLFNVEQWEQEAVFLDAAVASIKADDEWEDGASVSFTVDGVPGEARLRIDGPVSTVTLHRSGEVLSTARIREDGAVDVQLQHYRYVSEAPADELTISSSTLWKDGKIIASMDVTPLETGVAHVEAQVLDGEAFIRGTVQDATMQVLKLRLTPETAEADGKALAADLDGCLALGLYYPDIVEKAAVIGIGPLHRSTRFDDYWTWQWEVRFPDGLVSPVSQLTSYPELKDVSSALSSLKAQLAALLPHIYP